MLKRLGFVGVAAVPVMALGLFGHVASASAPAGSYVVNTSADATFNEADCTGSNTCTLRDAVSLSDLAGGSNTITFASSVTQPIDLSQGPLIVTGQMLTITGRGPTVTIIDGSNLTEEGVFDVFFSNCGGPCTHSSKATDVTSTAPPSRSPRLSVSNGALTLTGTTVRNSTHATQGGAVLVESQATLTASDDVFSGNSAANDGGAILNDGTSTITGSTFSTNSAGRGGAIDNAAGTASIGTSTFTSNTSLTGEGAGGAVSSQFSALTITQSVFTGNRASQNGGALYDIDNNGTADISNNTFTANKADDGNGNGTGGAATLIGGTVAFVNDTFSANTAVGGGAGAISTDLDDSEVGPTLTFSDTLVAANSAPNCDFAAAAGVTADHDIDSGTSCTFPASPTSLGNINSATGINLDSQLRDNGGPTQTLALLPKSIAIDAGSNATCKSQDQRTVSRPQHGTCDIGAFEADPTTTTVTASQATAGADVIITATVTGSTGAAGTPDGSVAFTKNGAPVSGSAPIAITRPAPGSSDSFVATLDLPVTTAADPLFGATFTPSNGFFGSSGSTSFTPTLATIPVPSTGAGGGAAGAGVLALLAGLGLVAGTRRRG